MEEVYNRLIWASVERFQKNFGDASVTNFSTSKEGFWSELLPESNPKGRTSRVELADSLVLLFFDED